jgi:Mg-chelatase subunit ChlD
MTTWIRKSFESHGLTQYPVGSYLSRIQERFGGSVVLCIDVSASMSGGRLTQAVAGAERFMDEALAGRYHVSIVLWDDRIQGSTELTTDRTELVGFLGGARARGGTDVIPALRLGEEKLEGRQADRVIAIFSDGGIGNPAGAMLEADRIKAKGIRIVTRGLGEGASGSLAGISSEDAGQVEAATEGSIADSVAGMAARLKHVR